MFMPESMTQSANVSSNGMESTLDKTPEHEHGPYYTVDGSGVGMEPVHARFSGAGGEADAIKLVDTMSQNPLIMRITISKTLGSRVFSIGIERNKDGEWRSIKRL
jgi:hypothetical protein